MTIDEQNPEHTDAGADAGEAATDSGGEASTDFGAGFESDLEDLVSDVPQDAGADNTDGQQPSDDPAAGGQEADPQSQQQSQPAEQQQAGQEPPPQQPPQQDQQQQDASVNLDSGAPLDQLLQTLAQNEAAVVQAAANNLFKLSDEDKEALETDAVAAMPQLAGKVYVKSLQAAANLMRNMAPQMMQQEMNKQNSLMAVEQAFFTQYPELDRWQHGADIVAVGQHFKAQNPNMPPQELLHRIATAVMGMHGIQRKPAASARNNGQQPFRPAQSGPARGQPNPADNPFAGLGMEFDE